MFTVRPDAGWQDSEVRVRTGYLVRCEPEGKWGDFYGLYGPAGNPETYKDNHHVKAPVYALLMKISASTNKVYYVGGATNITAERGGTLMFRANASLQSKMVGAMRVAITAMPDTDGDGVSDYEEVFILGTDPTVPDSRGGGFGDRLGTPRRSSRGTDTHQ